MACCGPGAAGACCGVVSADCSCCCGGAAPHPPAAPAPAAALLYEGQTFSGGRRASTEGLQLDSHSQKITCRGILIPQRPPKNNNKINSLGTAEQKAILGAKENNYMVPHKILVKC